MSLFPIFLKLKGRRCVVVGAGEIAAGKIAGLRRAGAQIVVISPQAIESIQAQASAGKLTWHAREFSSSDVEGALLVVAATNSGKTNEAVFRACAERGVLCNAVDDPEHCDFFHPSVVRRGPLQIAISTGGRSPSLARRLRQELEQQFGPEYEQWLHRLGKMRSEILQKKLPPAERHKALEELCTREAYERFREALALKSRKKSRSKAPSAGINMP